VRFLVFIKNISDLRLQFDYLTIPSLVGRWHVNFFSRNFQTFQQFWKF